VGSRIIGAEIGFDFNDSPSEEFAALSAHEDFAQQVRADEARIAIIERSGERSSFQRSH
jgi:hypothetical protein